MAVTVVDMKRGETGVVVTIEGGVGSTGRIQSMGVRVGKKVKKIGTNFKGGPQTLLVGSFKIAIGYGMAKKIFVEIDKSDPGNK